MKGLLQKYKRAFIFASALIAEKAASKVKIDPLIKMAVFRSSEKDAPG
jgi:hypothetical protein